MAAGARGAAISRAVVALATLVALGAGERSAQAAIAGGNSVTTTQHPDLRSATGLDQQDAQICFDKALSPTSPAFTASDSAMIYLTEYATSEVELPVTTTADPSNPNCADLAFDGFGGKLDLAQATIATAEPGAVLSAGSGGLGNLYDSITLAGSTTHNGTQGLSVAPDLSGPSPGVTAAAGALFSFAVTPANTITYTFDQAIDPGSLDASAQREFFMEDASGNVCWSDAAVQTSATTIVAHFGFAAAPPRAVLPHPAPVAKPCTAWVTPPLNESATDARRAGVNFATVFNIVDPSFDAAPNGLAGTNMPGVSGATAIPSLTSATLEANGNTVDYTFDHPLQSEDASGFFVQLSDGFFLGGNTLGASTGPNEVSVTYLMPSGDSLSFGDEYVVRAGVTGDGVVGVGTPTTTDSLGNTITNSPGSVAVGGNAGGFARGYTTGPDVYAVQFNDSPGVDVITLDLDQRALQGASDAVTSPSDINLLDAAGSVIGSPTEVDIPTTPTPGTQAVTMLVSPAVFALHPVAVQILGPIGFNATDGYCAFGTDLAVSEIVDGCSAPQIVSINAPSAHLRPMKAPSRRHARRATKHKAHGRRL